MCQRAFDPESGRIAPSPMRRIQVMTICLTRRFFLIWFIVLGIALPAYALRPDQIALVVNSRVPASLELAQLYAQTRNLPPGRIIELVLPVDEQMPMERFDADVIIPLRRALTERGLRGQVKCLVTFFGVPLKLSPRSNRPEEIRELAELQTAYDIAQMRLVEIVTSIERLVSHHDPTFRPDSASDIPQMLARGQTAIQRASTILQRQDLDLISQSNLETAIINTLAQVRGKVGLLQNAQPHMLEMLTVSPAVDGRVYDPEALWAQMQGSVLRNNVEIAELIHRRHDASSRSRLRAIAPEHSGLIDYLQLLAFQIEYLTADGTNSFDSELAMLWYPVYRKRGMLLNQLHYTNADRASSMVMMVARLDGPQSGTAHQIMLASRLVEEKGLTGRFVIDTLGLPPPQGPGDAKNYYDQRLLELARLVAEHTTIPVVLDKDPEVIRRDANQKLRDVALYCGWYSVRSYVPSMELNPGSVGYHIASMEMVSIRNPQESGWVAGLLRDGIAASVGPVDEPFLQGFPDPYLFYSLLLTGRFTLAETFWLTLPHVSWRVALIGDPLYNPFKANPQLDPKHLQPDLLQAITPMLQP